MWHPGPPRPFLGSESIPHLRKWLGLHTLGGELRQSREERGTLGSEATAGQTPAPPAFPEGPQLRPRRGHRARGPRRGPRRLLASRPRRPPRRRPVCVQPTEIYDGRRQGVLLQTPPASGNAGRNVITTFRGNRLVPCGARAQPHGASTPPACSAQTPWAAGSFPGPPRGRVHHRAAEAPQGRAAATRPAPRSPACPSPTCLSPACPSPACPSPELRKSGLSVQRSASRFRRRTQVERRAESGPGCCGPGTEPGMAQVSVQAQGHSVG